MRARGLWLALLLGWGALTFGATVEFALSLPGEGSSWAATSGTYSGRWPEGTPLRLSVRVAVQPPQALTLRARELPSGAHGSLLQTSQGWLEMVYVWTPPAGSSGKTFRFSFEAVTSSGTVPGPTVTVEVTAPPASPPQSSLTPGLRRWRSDQPLTWEDFRGLPPWPPTDELARIHLLFGYELTVGAEYDRGRGVWVARPTRLTVFNAMDPGKSWVYPHGRTPAALAHEQAHFDLQEVYRRAAERALQSLSAVGSTAKEAQAKLLEQAEVLFQQVSHANREAQLQFDRETDHGRNIAQQGRWRANIDRWLAEPPTLPFTWTSP